MTEATTLGAATVKRRQYLVVALAIALIIATALVSVMLTSSKDSGDRSTKLKSTSILAPGSQVDPKDAWRGQADAQLKAIEQKSRELSQRNNELAGQNKDMMEWLKKLEASGLTALPPPPIAAPAARPNFGPDRAGDTPNVDAPQRLPPPPPPEGNGSRSASGRDQAASERFRRRAHAF